MPPNAPVVVPPGRKIVTKLRFGTSAPAVQYFDSASMFRSGIRVCRKTGRCPICKTTLFAFDDGENDPRGVLGDHAASTAEYGNGKDDRREVTLCFLHANEEWSYKAAERYAKPVR